MSSATFLTSQVQLFLFVSVFQQVLLVTFYKEATFFISQMQEVIPCACDLLGSSNATDVKEAVTFLESCQVSVFVGRGSDQHSFFLNALVCC